MLHDYPIIEVNEFGLTLRGRVWAFVAKARGAFSWSDLRRTFNDVPPATFQGYVRELVQARILATSNDEIFSQDARNADATFYALHPDAIAAPLLELPRCFAPDYRRNSIHVPPSEDGAWRLMLHLTKKGRPISRRGLEAALVGEDFTAQRLHAFITCLIHAGYLRKTPVTDELALIKRQRETPRVAQNGKPLAHAARANHLWRAMKMCGYFTARELAIAATTPQCPVSESQAERFANELALAGYLIQRDPAPKAATIYRLKPRMNTGPDAPRMMRARFVWDPNLCRVFGAATKVEEVKL